LSCEGRHAVQAGSVDDDSIGMKLYGFRNGRTLRALWALEETGAEYKYVEVDLVRGEQRSEWYLKLNPAGKGRCSSTAIS